MPFNQGNSGPLFKLLGDSFQQSQEASNQQGLQQQKNDQAMALQKYLKGSVGDNGQYSPGVEAASQKAQQEYEIDSAKKLQEDFSRRGQKVNTKIGNIDLSIAPPSLKAMLTPAQESSEKEAGKKISDFEGGGKASSEANVSQIQDVQKDLATGKRDSYDKYVGGALENHPTLMSFFAPAEKARRDRVQNAMLSMLHDAGIPRPTQWDIQRVFGQVYDPASDDQTNISRLTQATTKINAHNQALQNQANQYHKTGYATIGGQPAPKQPAAPAPFDPDSFLQGK